MATLEVPPEEWQDFFDSFSRKHRGWLVDIDVFGKEHGKEFVRRLPLDGIAVESLPTCGRGTCEGDRCDRTVIELQLGHTAESHITHTILRPTSVKLKQTIHGADEVLEVHSRDGLATLVSFRSSVPPELVDGLP
jgi:hypothetical protein